VVKVTLVKMEIKDIKETLAILELMVDR